MYINKFFNYSKSCIYLFDNILVFSQKKKKKLKNFIFYFFEELYVLHHVQWLKKISVYSV